MATEYQISRQWETDTERMITDMYQEMKDHPDMFEDAFPPMGWEEEDDR
jgi:hypothetical protein